MILEKQELRLRKKRYKTIIKNAIAFIIVGIVSVGLLMLGAILDTL